MRGCLTCPHTSSSSSSSSSSGCMDEKEAQGRILQVQDAGSVALHDPHRIWRLCGSFGIPIRTCVTSTARPSDKRSPGLLCRFLCPVLCEFLSIQGRGPFMVRAPSKKETRQVRCWLA